MAPINPAVASAVAASGRTAAQKIPRDPAKAPRGQRPTVYPPPQELAPAVQGAAGGGLPPRLQNAVASGKLTAEQAGQRFEQFKAGKLPGQGGGGGSTSLGPMATAGEFGQSGQSVAGGGAPPQGTMVAQSLPGRVDAPFQGGYGAAGGAAGAAGGVGDLARQLPNRGGGAGAAAGQPNPEQLQQLMARLRGVAGGGGGDVAALNPNGVQPQGRPMNRGGLQAQTEVLQGPGGGPMNEKPMPGGFQGVSQNLDQLDGGPMNAKPMPGGFFGAQGLPGQEDPIRQRVKGILGAGGGPGGARRGGLQLA